LGSFGFPVISEKPGDEARGVRVFKRCTECHDLSATKPGGGPPVAAWESLGDPIALAAQMWNHSAQMHAAMIAKKVKWPQLDGQELTDLLVYLQSNRAGKGMYGEFGSAEKGQALFEERGCTSCHKKANSLENRGGHRTMADLAAAMWDHSPQMRQPPPKLSGVFGVNYFFCCGSKIEMSPLAK
jgi:cytochrome c2